MIRIAALNDSSGEDDSRDVGSVAVGRKEAKEAEAFTLYNKALTLQRQGQIDQAEDVFEELLDHEFIIEASKLVEDGMEGAVHPGLQLLYSIHKNMATMALHRGDDQSAIKSYIEAVKIDESEVTVWYKMGIIALKLVNFPLARLGFEQGLNCNPNHWPCLDNVITVLYTMNDYWNCLYYISQALEKDYLYTKGLVIRNQIYKEQPSLKQDSMEFFLHCDPSIHMYDIEQEEADQYIQEALDMRIKRRELAKIPDPPPITLPNTIKTYTWKSLGETLVNLYDSCKNSIPQKSLARRVDLTAYADITIDSLMTSQTQDSQNNAPSEEVTEDKMDTSEVKETPLDANPEQQPTNNDEVAMETDDKQDNTNLAVPLISDDVVPVTPTTVVSSPLVTSLTSTAGTNTIMATQNTCSSPIDFKDSAGRNKAPKRKRGFFEEDYGVKRRSARVRNTYNRRKEEETTVNFQELLLSFLPSSLKQGLDEEDTDVKTTESNEKQPEESSNKTDQGDVTAPAPQTVSVFASQEKEVLEFLKGNQKNSGTIGLMCNYMFYLANNAGVKWPRGLAEIFLQVYSRVRKHFDLPDCFGDEYTEEREYILNVTKTCLVSAELQLDLWMVKRSKMIGSPGGSPRSPGHGAYLLSSDLPEYCLEDLWFLSSMITQSELLGDYWIQHGIRAHWMRARLHILQGEIEDALLSFQQTINYLNYGKENYNISEIQLYNCEVDSVIAPDIVKRQQESLQRYQSSEETQKLFDCGNYEKVVEFLLQTFTHQGKSKVVSLNTGVPERQAQLLLLQESLYKLADFKKALLWGEVSFNEAVQCYKRASTSVLKEEWSSTIAKICADLIKVTEKDGNLLKTLPSMNTMRFTQNLIYLIDTMMSVLEGAVEMPLGTVLPWILLYKLIKQEEDKMKAMLLSDASNTGSSDFDNSIPSSLMLLNIAHDYLGRLSWCTKSDGALLLFFVDVLLEELSSSSTSAFKEELEQAFEQCIFCLYGHPNKKGKARHLLDHNAPLIHLVWDKAVVVFEYFKPKTVPEFDGYKQDTISGEIAFLLKRIAHLVPEAEKPSHHIDAVLEYIEGNTNKPPSPNTDNVSQVVKELYYLLADYYFKNKEQAKAIKFYLCDICVNPDRLDSWAGMALARMSQLEQKLNAMELKLDVQLYKKSISALRCFKRAMEIDNSNTKLWIEYGSLAYQLHSHSSRQLKMKEWFPLSQELLQISTDTRQEMLQTAYNCYKKAWECDTDEHEDEWLKHYMMGKCLEKLRKAPEDYLHQYTMAATCLYEENATYPKKINYSYTSPHLAVEALEMFYRLHVAAVKQILKNKCTDQDCWVLQKYIDETASSPFARCQEKRHEKQYEKESSLSSYSDDLSSSLPGFTRKPKPPFSSQDHTYSKQKSIGPISDSERSESQNFNSQSSEILSEVRKSKGVLELSAEPVSNDNCLSSDNSVIQVAKKPSVTSPPAKPFPFSMASILGETQSGMSGSKDSGSSEIVKQASFGFDVDESGISDISQSKDEVADSENKKMELSALDKNDKSKMSELQSHSVENQSDSKGNKFQVVEILSSSKAALETMEMEPCSVKQETSKGEMSKEGKKMSDKTSVSDEKSDITVTMDTETSKAQETFTMETMSCEKVQSDEQSSKTKDDSKMLDSSVVPMKKDSDAMDSGHQELTSSGSSAVVKEKCTSMEVEETQGIHENVSERSTDADAKTSINNGEAELKGLKSSVQKMTKEIDVTDKNATTKNENDDDAKTSVNVGEAELKDVKSSEINMTDENATNKNETDLSNKSGLCDDVDMENTNKEEKTQDICEASKVKIEEDKDSIKIEKVEVKTENKETDIEMVEESNLDLAKNDQLKGGGESVQKDEIKKEDDGDQNKTDADNALKLKRKISDTQSGDLSKTDTVNEMKLKSEISESQSDEIRDQDKKAMECENSDRDIINDVINEMVNQIARETINAEKQDVRGIEKDTKTIDGVLSVTADSDTKNQSEIKNADDSSNKHEVGKVKDKDVTMKVVIDLTDLDEEVLETLKDKQHETDGTTEKRQGKNSQSEVSKTMETIMVKGSSSEERKTGQSLDEENKNEENLQGKSENKQGEQENKEVNKLGDKESKTSADKEERKEDLTSKDDGNPESSAAEAKLTGEPLRKDVLEKCITAFHLCVSRFPTHYKSLYQLAYIYYHSPYHKNLQFARDMLLGTSKWSHLNHMPGQGLFGERKQNNFFQGVWKMPVEEIDRSGSFATHLNRSVGLLLKILVEMKDVSMLYYIHVQMSRSPDSGKKYLRDGERAIFAKEAFARCLDAVIAKVPDIKLIGDPEKQLKYLMEVYKIWNHGIYKLKRHLAKSNRAFTLTFEAVCNEKVDPDTVLNRAIEFCQNYQQQSIHTRSRHPSGGKSGQDTGGSSQSDSSIFSPERPSVQTPQKSTPPERNLLMSMLMSPTNSQSSSPLSSCGRPVSQSPMGSQSSITSSQSSNVSPCSSSNQGTNRYASASNTPEQQQKKIANLIKTGQSEPSTTEKLTASSYLSSINQSDLSIRKVKIDNSSAVSGGSNKGHPSSESSVKYSEIGSNYDKTSSSGVKTETSKYQNNEDVKVSSQSEVGELELDPVTGLFVKVVPTSGDTDDVSSKQEEKSNKDVDTLAKQSVNKGTTDSESDFDVPDVVSPQTPQMKTISKSTLSKEKDSVSKYHIPNVVTPNTPVLSATEKLDFRKTQTGLGMKTNVYKLNETNKPVAKTVVSKPAITVRPSSNDVIEILSSSEEERETDERVRASTAADDNDDDDSIPSSVEENLLMSDNEKPSTSISKSKVASKRVRQKSRSDDEGYDPSYMPSSDGSESDSCEAGGPAVASVGNPSFLMESPSEFCSVQQPPLQPQSRITETTDSDSQNSSFVANPEHLYFDINELMDLDD